MKNHESDDYDFLDDPSFQATRAERLLDGFERVTTSVSQAVASVVLFPFRWLRKPPAPIFDELDDEEAPLYDFDIRPPLSARMLMLLRRLIEKPMRSSPVKGVLAEEEDEKLLDVAPPGVGQRLSSLLGFVGFHIGSVFCFLVLEPFLAGCHFVQIWLLSRDYRKLLYAIPTLLFLIFCFGLASLSALSSPQKLAARYRLAAATAVANGDFEAAKLCQAKLERLQPSNTQDAYMAAEQLAEAGEMEEALQRMQQLAPVDELGYLPAHLWIAHALTTGQVTPADEDPQELIKLHLDRALLGDPKNAFALLLLAEHHATQGDTEAAVKTLQQVSTPNREVQLELDMRRADFYRRDGDLAKADEILRQSTEGLAKMFAKGKSLSADSFANWANAQIQLGAREDAVRILQLGIEQHPDDERLMTAYRAECVALQEIYSTSVDLADKYLALLRRMLAFEPNEEEVMLLIASACGQSSISDQAQRLLQPQLDEGTLPVEVYDRLANAALARGDHSQARRLYTLVLKMDPQRPIALNNLAWMLAHNEPTSFERALTLIEQAIAIDDSNSNLHGTRGLILMKLERWAEASQELEVALNGTPQHAQLYHESLATANERIGNQELSALHRNRSLSVVESSTP